MSWKDDLKRSSNINFPTDKKEVVKKIEEHAAQGMYSAEFNEISTGTRVFLEDEKLSVKKVWRGTKDDGKNIFVVSWSN